MKIQHSVIVTAAVLLTACASPTVVQTVKPGDSGLSCAQLQNEFADAEKLRAEAEKEKTVTGGNVVRALFFWPAILERRPTPTRLLPRRTPAKST